MKFTISLLILAAFSFMMGAEPTRIQPGTPALALDSVVQAAADRANLVGRLQLANKPRTFVSNFSPVVRNDKGRIEKPLTGLFAAFYLLEGVDYVQTKAQRPGPHFDVWESNPAMSVLLDHEPMGGITKAAVPMVSVYLVRELIWKKGYKKFAYGLALSFVGAQTYVVQRNYRLSRKVH